MNHPLQFILILFFTVLSLESLLASGSGSATASSSAISSARIVQPLEITKQADLSFGNIASGVPAGKVNIATNGMRTASGGVTLISAGSVSSAASFDIQEYPLATFSIVLPGSISIHSANKSMLVKDFVSSLGTTSSLDAQGVATIHIGASLIVSAKQSQGLYSGTFDVVAAYN